jgi:phosphate transport system substrate-binding protein
MADKVHATAWSIGYTEANLAQTASLRVARIKNAAGEFVPPTTKSISASVSEFKMRDDFRISLTNAPGKDSYPISSFTWLYVPSKANDPERGRALVDYLRWLYADGQVIARDRGYATLPNDLLAKVTASLSRIQ